MASADWLRIQLQTQIEDQMERAKSNPTELKRLRDHWSNPGNVQAYITQMGGDVYEAARMGGAFTQLAEHVRNLYADKSADKYFEGGPTITDPGDVGPVLGSIHKEALRAPGEVSPWTQLQIDNMRGDVSAQKAALPGQIATQGAQAVQQAAMRGGIKSSQSGRVPIIGQRRAMFGRQQIGRAGALGEQGLRLQDEQQRQQQLQGATQMEQGLLNTNLKAWAGQKLGEAY
jgi:hypothetical protein